MFKDFDSFCVIDDVKQIGNIFSFNIQDCSAIMFKRNNQTIIVIWSLLAKSEILRVIDKFMIFSFCWLFFVLLQSSYCFNLQVIANRSEMVIQVDILFDFSRGAFSDIVFMCGGMTIGESITQDISVF